MKNTSYVVNAPSVVSEVIDGELVIMNLQTGSYYSAEDSGAVLWGWIEKGYGLKDIGSLLVSHYCDVSDDVDDQLREFVATLLENDLIRENGEAPPCIKLSAPGGGRPVFHSPEINIYTDMKDMLLLDPIHDVDETGWPMPNPDAD